MKDLGVIIDEKLNFRSHVSQVISSANKKLGIIHRSFKHLDADSFLMLYKSLVRPSLEYCNNVWVPRFLEDEDRLEKLQQKATRFISELRGLNYVTRLKKINLPTLSFRRKRASYPSS